jgi:hypothetical protein
VREAASDRLAELQAVQRAYAELYRDTPLTNASAILERIRTGFDVS